MLFFSSSSADFILCSLGCTILAFMASYENYPSGYALKALHKMGELFLSHSRTHATQHRKLISFTLALQFYWTSFTFWSVALTDIEISVFTFLLLVIISLYLVIGIQNRYLKPWIMNIENVIQNHWTHYVAELAWFYCK